MSTTFQDQNNELFIDVINEFHKLFKLSFEEQEALKQRKNIWNEPSLELFLTPHCNQNCNYCYLQAHKNELYPIEYQNNELILKNLRILLDYYLEEKMSLSKVDLFSGEILGYPFCNQVFDILLEYIDKGLPIKHLSIPSNCSFCFSSELIKIVEHYISEFEFRKTHVNVSVSWDGPILDSIQRPIRNNKINKSTEDFVSNLCHFMQKHGYGFHPMVDADNIELQIDNYKAWVELLNKYFPEEHKILQHGRVMQLEVRSNKWTTEKIISYLKWLKFYIDTDIKEYFNGDKNLFKDICLGNVSKTNYFKEQGYCNAPIWNPYFPYTLNTGNKPSTVLGCSLGRALTVRLGDMAIVPCHRTSYPKLVLGKYIIENDKIIGLECQNYPLTSAVYLTSFANKPICDTCALSPWCIKSCLGLNYEVNKELFYPEEHNCELQKAKFIFLCMYYSQLEIMPQSWQQGYDELTLKEPEVINKWHTIIQSII